MRIYLVRHGEAQDDVEDCYGGIADFPLSDGGKQTAGQVARTLTGKNIQRIYSSPYKRASETASVAGNFLGCEVRHIDGLRERNSYGVLSGVNKAKAQSIFGHVLAAVPGKPGDYYSAELVVGAEPVEQFDTRVKSAVAEIIRDAQGLDAICIVTHGNVTRSVYKNILHVHGKVDLGLLAVTELSWSEGKFCVLSSEGVSVEVS